MKKLFIVMFAIISLQAFAFDAENSDKLIRILVDNNIAPTSVLEATIYCKTSEKGSQFGKVCTIYAGPPGFELNSNSEDLSGERAQELSKIINKFDIKPRGKSSLQSAHMKCMLPKENLENQPSCLVLQQYEMSDY